MRINVMNKNEEFLDMHDNMIFLRNEKGEIRVVLLQEGLDGLRVDKEREIKIGFGDGTVEYSDDGEDVEIVNF